MTVEEVEVNVVDSGESEKSISTCGSNNIISKSTADSEILDFNNLGLDGRLTGSLHKMGIDTPTLIQSQGIPLVLSGKDLLGRAPTGSGKTLAYVLPVLHKILNFCGSATTSDSETLKVQAIILVPTKELALQVSSVIDKISRYCTKESLRVCNLAQEDSLSLQVAALQATEANLLVSTPSRLLPHLMSSLIRLEEGHFHTLVLDEADLILSFGFQNDLDALVPFLPKLFQTLLFSATLSDDLDDLRALLLHSPVILKIDDEEIGSSDFQGGRTLKQYSIPATGDEKFLFTFVTLKLNLLKGKILIFCNSTDRAYKLKLYLDQFGVKCGVLNPELPLMSRHAIVDQFNRSVFDILIAADETGNAVKMVGKNREGGVARGVDFKRVDVVFNFDFPGSLDAYTHRVGRTARGKDGRGTALSLIDSEVDSESTINEIRTGVKLTDFPFPLDQLESFRYRSLDALRSTTKAAVKRARASEFSKQVLASQKLSTSFFSSRPKDLQMLRNDAAIRGKGVRIQQHLKHVPGYLLESVGAKSTSVSNKNGSNQGSINRSNSSKREASADSVVIEEQLNSNGNVEDNGNESLNVTDTGTSIGTRNGTGNGNGTGTSGLFENKRQKRFANNSKYTTPSIHPTHLQIQTIIPPSHLKLPQTVPTPSRTNGNGNGRNFGKFGRGGGKFKKPKNDPLKSGKLMN